MLSELPVDLSFLGRVDLGQLDALVVEKDFHVIEKELVRIGVRDIEAEVIDQLFLLLLPFGPAAFTHLAADLLTQFRWDGGITKRFALLPTASAFEFVTK